MTWLNELLWYLGAVGAVLILRVFVLSFTLVDGRSMLDTLYHQDWLLIWRLPYCFRRPKRQEVVICHYPGRRRRRFRFLPQAFVKRVVGVPGDTLEIIEGQVHINGRPLHEPYLTPERCRWMRERAPVTLGRDEYFVMGDNRDSSNDSRRIGPIRRRHIVGRVVCIFWPWQRMRKVR